MGSGMASDKKSESPSVAFFAATLVSAIAAGDIAKAQLQPNAAMGVECCFIAMTVVAWVRWDLRSRWWFWLALLVGAALQVPLMFLMPWAAPHMAGPGAMVFAIPGFVAALGCVFLAEKLSSTRSS